MNLSTRIAALGLPHPFLLASGPLSHNGEAIARAHLAGAAAVVTKTISRTAAIDPSPSIVLERAGTLLNAERWSTLTSSAWIEHHLPLAKEAGAIVIASVGLAPPDVAALAAPLEKAGADALEIVSYDESVIAAMVAEAVRCVRIPVIAKISVNWSDPISAAASCVARGAAAVTASDSIGPALRIDVESRRPRLGSASAWVSGGSLFPIALHLIARLSAALPPSVPIIGTGGVTCADDALEMLMAGATAIGICTSPVLHGLSTFARLPKHLAIRLAELGFDACADCIGAARIPELMPAAGRTEIAPKLVLAWDAAACNHCQLCAQRCPYGARSSADPTNVEPHCHLCGLCVSACPTGALSWKRQIGGEAGDFADQGGSQ